MLSGPLPERPAAAQAPPASQPPVPPDTRPPQEEKEWNAKPFELRVLDVTLEWECGRLEAAVKALEADAKAAIDALGKKACLPGPARSCPALPCPARPGTARARGFVGEAVRATCTADLCREALHEARRPAPGARRSPPRSWSACARSRAA